MAQVYHLLTIMLGDQSPQEDSIPTPCVPGTLGGGSVPVWALPLSVPLTQRRVDMSVPGPLTGDNQGRRPKAVPGS